MLSIRQIEIYRVSIEVANPNKESTCFRVVLPPASGATCNELANLTDLCPAPSSGQFVKLLLFCDLRRLAIATLPPIVRRLLPLHRHFRQLRLLPSTPALLADPLQQHRRRLDVRILDAPIRRQFAAKGGGEDGLAESLQQRRDGIESFAGASGALLKGFETGDDASLFVDRRDRYPKLCKICRLQIIDIDPRSSSGNRFAIFGSLEIVAKPTRHFFRMRPRETTEGTEGHFAVVLRHMSSFAYDSGRTRRHGNDQIAFVQQLLRFHVAAGNVDEIIEE